MVTIKETNAEEYESMRAMIDTIQTVVSQIGHDLQELKREVSQTDTLTTIKTHARIVDELQTNMKKLVALTSKEISINDYLTSVKAKALAKALMETDAEGKPVNTNESKREMATNAILFADLDYQANKKVLEDTQWEKKQTILNIDCLKLDLKHVELVLEHR